MSPSASVAATAAPMSVPAAVFSATERAPVSVDGNSGAVLAGTAGVALAGSDTSPPPCVFHARTLKLYRVPLVSPVTV